MAISMDLKELSGNEIYGMEYTKSTEFEKKGKGRRLN